MYLHAFLHSHAYHSHTDDSFPIELWNHFNELERRTKNFSEGYNSKVKTLIGHKPHLWKFLKVLKDEEVNEDSRFRRFEAGVKDRRRNRRDVDRDLKIL